MRAKNVARLLLAPRKASPSISRAEDSDGKGNPRCWQETRTTCRCAGSVPLSSLNRERRPETSCQSRSPSSHHSQDRPTTSREAEIRPGRKTTLPPPEQGVPPRTPQLLSAVPDTPSTRSPWKIRQRVHSPHPCIMMHPATHSKLQEISASKWDGQRLSPKQIGYAAANPRARCGEDAKVAAGKPRPIPSCTAREQEEQWPGLPNGGTQPSHHRVLACCWWEEHKRALPLQRDRETQSLPCPYKIRKPVAVADPASAPTMNQSNTAHSKVSRNRAPPFNAKGPDRRTGH